MFSERKLLLFPWLCTAPYIIATPNNTKYTPCDFDKRMSLSRRANTELERWVVNEMTAKNVMTRDAPLHKPRHRCLYRSLRSTVRQSVIRKFWSLANHINYLELLASSLGLKDFCSSHRDMHISLMMDNTTAVAVINHRDPSYLNALNNEIWDWCVACNLWISAGDIAGKSNVEADQASSYNQAATEWMLQKTLL